MEDGDSVFTHISRFELLNSQLILNGRTIEDADLAVILILSVENVSRFSTLVTTLRLESSLTF